MPCHLTYPIVVSLPFFEVTLKLFLLQAIGFLLRILIGDHIRSFVFFQNAVARRNGLLVQFFAAVIFFALLIFGKLNVNVLLMVHRVLDGAVETKLLGDLLNKSAITERQGRREMEGFGASRTIREDEVLDLTNEALLGLGYSYTDVSVTQQREMQFFDLLKPFFSALCMASRASWPFSPLPSR